MPNPSLELNVLPDHGRNTRDGHVWRGTHISVLTFVLHGSGSQDPCLPRSQSLIQPSRLPLFVVCSGISFFSPFSISSTDFPSFHMSNTGLFVPSPLAIQIPSTPVPISHSKAVLTIPTLPCRHSRSPLAGIQFCAHAPSSWPSLTETIAKFLLQRSPYGVNSRRIDTGSRPRLSCSFSRRSAS